MTQSPIDVGALAHAYRRLVLWFGVQLLLSISSAAIQAATADAAVGVLLSFLILGGMLATLAALVYYGYRTANALGSGVAWLWGVGMLIPCVNVITLLTLSAKATRACRANNIEVGFLGPKV
jgi:hypothetical protein